MYAADGENPKYAKIKERREAAGVNINDDDLKQAISLAGKLVNILKSDDDSGAKLEKEITLRDNMYTILLKDYVRISRYRNIIK